MKRKLKLKKNTFLLLLLALVFTFSTTKLVLYYIDLANNKKDNQKLIEKVFPSKEIKEESEKIDFNKLSNINSDTKGWIRYNHNKVNYPVVQTSNNDYYLNHSFEKKKSSLGAIFMDYRNQEFENQNTVIYGHSTKNQSMFGSLEEMDDNDFFNEEDNNYIELLTTDNRSLKYQIFSYYIIKKEEYYITPSFNSNSEYESFINTIKKRSKKKFDIEVTTNDKILTLSTCYGTGNTTKRRVVHAKLREEKKL